MKMLRHHHIPEDRESVFLPDFFQNLEEQIFAAFGSEKWPTMVTGARNEMQPASTVPALQTPGHVEILLAHPFFRSRKNKGRLLQKEWGTHDIVRLRKSRQEFKIKSRGTRLRKIKTRIQNQKPGHPARKPEYLRKRPRMVPFFPVPVFPGFTVLVTVVCPIAVRKPPVE